MCSKCATPWFSRLESGKPNVLTFDYFIKPEWSYAQMLALPEFGDALIEFWPRALEMMSQDPEDLTVAVDDVLSGTNARRFYRSRRNDIKFDLKPGRRSCVASSAFAAIIHNPLRSAFIPPPRW